MPGFSRPGLGPPPPCAAAFIGLGGNLGADGVMPAVRIWLPVRTRRPCRVALGCGTSPSGNSGARPRNQQRFPASSSTALRGLIPSDVQAGYADPPVLRDADDTQGPTARRAARTAPARSQSRQDPPGCASARAPPRSHGVAAEHTVEPAHRTLIGVGTQNLFGETAYLVPTRREYGATGPAVLAGFDDIYGAPQAWAAAQRTAS